MTSTTRILVVSIVQVTHNPDYAKRAHRVVEMRR